MIGAVKLNSQIIGATFILMHSMVKYMSNINMMSPKYDITCERWDHTRQQNNTGT